MKAEQLNGLRAAAEEAFTETMQEMAREGIPDNGVEVPRWDVVDSAGNPHALRAERAQMTEDGSVSFFIGRICVAHFNRPICLKQRDES